MLFALSIRFSKSAMPSPVDILTVPSSLVLTIVPRHKCHYPLAHTFLHKKDLPAPPVKRTNTGTSQVLGTTSVIMSLNRTLETRHSHN